MVDEPDRNAKLGQVVQNVVDQSRGRELLLRDSPDLTDVLISVDLTPPPTDEIADEIVATSRSAQEAELAASG